MHETHQEPIKVQRYRFVPFKRADGRRFYLMQDQLSVRDADLARHDGPGLKELAKLDAWHNHGVKL